MDLREIKDKKTWEDFLSGCGEKTFLQSFYWGDFQRLMGNKFWRFGLFEKGELVATALVNKIKAKRGSFFLIQHGPNIKKEKHHRREEVLGFLLSQLRKMGKEEKVSFVRISPLWQKSEENEKIARRLGLREAPMHASSYDATLKLDISLSEDELLRNMRKTTRYVIRQTLKNPDISVQASDDIKDIGKYQRLNQEVAKRQRFVPFSSDFIKKEFEVFAKENKVLLFLGKYRNETAAGALVIFWSGVAFYHQAASLEKYKRFSIPYRVLWESILKAKDKNCRLYDFWGYVDPKKYPLHPWAGPTLFKMGFGGRPCLYLKTQDLVLNKKYFFTFLVEKLRKKKRRL